MRDAVENAERARRVARRAWSFVAAGLVLLVMGAAVVVLVEQPVQRIVLGVVAAPIFVVLAAQTIRQVLRERREGVEPPSREAARRAPLLSVGTVLFGWGLTFVGFQAVTPKPELDSALLQAAPFAIIWLGGLGPIWKLHREMKRERVAGDT